MLIVRGSWENYAAYVFCLCLSYFRWKQEQGAPINPWLLFEDLACIAARKYMDGEVCKFGEACRAGTTAFEHAINRLCQHLGEGYGFKKQPTFRRKDDKVDLVAWKHFSDRLPSKLVMFGQCAAGADWPNKVSEMDPEAFWHQWMSDAKTSPLVSSFFIPFRVPHEQWTYYARYAGVLFDRCRVVYWACRDRDTIERDARYVEWSKSVLGSFVRGDM